MGLTPEFITEYGNNVVMQLSNLLESPKVRDAESGAILTEFFAQRYITSIFKKTAINNVEQTIDSHTFTIILWRNKEF